MKGKTHLMLTTAIMLFLVYPLYVFIVNEDLNIFMIGFALLAAGAGSILPDADIEDRKSRIFYSIFLPIGIIVRLLEYPLAIFLKKEARHHGVLHHPIGAVFSSLIPLLFFSLFLYIFHALSFKVAAYFYVVILLSQFLHLLEDWIRGAWFYIFLMITLVAITFFRMKEIL